MTFFEDVLQSNTCMSEFTFQQYYWNRKDSLATVIASALKKNAGPVLEKLTISAYSFDQFVIIVHYLSKMKYLRKLDLLVYNVEIAYSIAELLQALKRNSSI